MVLKDKITKITFHNGVLTIGGTIIEIAYKDSHIYFDFGSEFDPSISPQPATLQELLDSNLLPYLDNVFDKNISISGYDNKSTNFKHTGVFLSHVHLDHSKIVNYLDPSIPLYTLEGTKSLLNTLNINNDFLFPLADNSSGNTRDIIGVGDNETITVGDINVTMIPVDHDAYGACGMLIKTPDLVISYTGDLRLHGYRDNDTIEFCKKSENCDILLIEGVSVSFQELDEVDPEETVYSEGALVDDIKSIIDSNPNKQITFNYYISNIERIVNIINSVSRDVVLDAYYAYVVKQATNMDCYYYNIGDNNYNLDPKFEISFDTLLNDESKYFWQLDLLALKYLDKLKKGGIYIHSNAVPLGEFDPSYKPFVESFEKQDISFMTVSSSGHAHPHDLIKIIDLIKPKLLIPIHSYHPERLYNKHGEVLLPQKNQTI